MTQLRVQWRARQTPLAPLAVLGRGLVRNALLQRCLRHSTEELAAFSGVYNEDLVVLLGETDRLPWIDGVEYFGRDPLAPSLLLPTTLEPTAPLILFERAVEKALRGQKTGYPWLILSDWTVVPIGGARPVSHLFVDSALGFEGTE